MRAYNGEQALEQVRAISPDAVFIERSLPDISGPDLCRRLGAENALPVSTPLIVTTSGPVTHDQRIDALRAGAWEIISLPIDAEELLLRLQRYTRAKMEADRAEQNTRTDAETGFYNRLGVFQRADELMAAAARYGRPMACVVFEPVAGNGDGNGIGELLSEIVEILKESTRRSDVIGRIDHRQFAILAPDTEPGGAEILANRLRERSTGVNVRGRFHARAGVFGVSDPDATRIDSDELIRRAMPTPHDPGSPRLN